MNRALGEILAHLARRPVLGPVVFAVPATFFSVVWWLERGKPAEEYPLQLVFPAAMWLIVFAVAAAGVWQRRKWMRTQRQLAQGKVSPPAFTTGPGFFFFAATGVGFGAGAVISAVVGLLLGIAVMGALALLAIVVGWRERPRRVVAAVGANPPRVAFTLCFRVAAEAGGGEDCHLFVCTDHLHVWRTGASQHEHLAAWIGTGGVPDRENHAPYKFAVKNIASIAIAGKKNDEVHVTLRRPDHGGEPKTTKIKLGTNADSMGAALHDLGWQHHEAGRFTPPVPPLRQAAHQSAGRAASRV